MSKCAYSRRGAERPRVGSKKVSPTNRCKIQGRNVLVVREHWNLARTLLVVFSTDSFRQ